MWLVGGKATPSPHILMSKYVAEKWLVESNVCPFINSYLKILSFTRAIMACKRQRPRLAHKVTRKSSSGQILTHMKVYITPSFLAKHKILFGHDPMEALL